MASSLPEMHKNQLPPDTLEPKRTAHDEEPAPQSDKESQSSMDGASDSEVDPKAEKRFLWKLDILLLTWAWLAYCIKQIDSANYKTAYVSGMKEDRNMVGNQLNFLDTFFRIGYALFLIPSQIILTKVPAGYWLPGLELAWGVLTGLMAVVRPIEGMYVLRFFIGVFEASSYPGIVSVLCSWYTPTELATRIAIFSTSYPGGNLFVSFMQAALHKNMNGKAGLAGWQWLFIFNALMTVVVAAAGFFLMPNNPDSVGVSWLNKEEQAIARARMQRAKKLPATGLSWKVVRKVFSSWMIYVYTPSTVFWAWSQNSNSWIILFLKAAKNADGSLRFTIPEINAIPIGGYVLQIVTMIAYGWISDKTGWRAFWVIIQQLTLLVGTIILSVWPAGFGLKMFAYFILWISNACGPILLAWMADLTPSPEERSIIIGVAFTSSFAVDSFANIFIYPAVEAPNYRIGYKAASAFAVASILFTCLFSKLAGRKNKS